MLVLKNIVKNYVVGDTKVEALRGVDLEFRKNEFVSILGPSGCGKTTMLNIIGGLDRYSEGDLTVDGVSTREFKDSDWDKYRNCSIGFVFQTYNLIPHQTVLANVELALTLSGVSKNERKARAIEALKKVGLGDQIHKKPNQVSGGQMQRVAIARSLVNNPDILLADEPTGALDSETSVQIMEILKEVAKDRLVIMVTHNPDLAEKYSTRIIRLLDGKVLSDTNPYHVNVTEPLPKEKKLKEKKNKKTSMSFLTALSLSLNNLMTKKARTLLTSFAGSIGIIGIALILSLSQGTQIYIDNVQKDTMSSYPLTIEQATMDMSTLVSSTINMRDRVAEHDLDKIYSYNIMNEMLNSMSKGVMENDLKSLKKFIDSDESGIKELTEDIKYGYSTQMNIYKSDTSDGVYRVNPSSLMSGMRGMMTGTSGSSGGSSSGLMGMMSSQTSLTGSNVWNEMTGSKELLSSQYDVIAGKMPESFDEIVIICDENNEITDFTLYSIGLMDPDEVSEMMKNIASKKETVTEQKTYTYDELLKLTFKLVLNTDYYEKVGEIWIDRSESESYMKKVVSNGTDLKVVGILRPKSDAAVSSVGGSVGYRSDLMKHLVSKVNDSQIVKEQKAKPETDIFTGIAFDNNDNKSAAASFDMSTLSDEQKTYFMTLTEEERNALLESMAPVSKTTYSQNMRSLGVSDVDDPSTIYIFPKDFETKDKITQILSDYNQRMKDEGHDEKVITYTDFIKLIMSSVTTIINAISYILIAFVAISLVVSSIMIGIITYISVLERTKEIGILRSIGASKGDISSVFNAETLIVGFVAGALGIIVTLLMLIPINAIIKMITDITALAVLPPVAAAALVLISMVLTFIAGLIPSSLAAKKDPVVALRTE